MDPREYDPTFVADDDTQEPQSGNMSSCYICAVSFDRWPEEAIARLFRTYTLNGPDGPWMLKTYILSLCQSCKKDHLP